MLPASPRDLGVMFAANALAVLAGALLFFLVLPEEWPTWARLLAADVAATVLIWLLGTALRCASLYDPWWSVAPPFLAAAWLYLDSEVLFRELLALALVTIWGARLTFNFLRGWRGLHQEDWRYVDLRAKSGPAFFLVNLSGIHLMPTLMVFAGCLALIPIYAEGAAPLGVLDGLGAALALFATWLEARADKQLHDFVRAGAAEGEILDAGLWAWSRHPNYLGEILFWWGLALVGLGAAPGAYWILGGPAAITLLFVVISLPMIEKRHRARRPRYAEYAARVPMLVPWRGPR